MFSKFSRSLALVRASADVLRADKELLVFPLLATLAGCVVIASFVVPAFLGGLFGDDGRHPDRVLLGVLVFAFYLVQYSVVFFFNTALVGAALIRLRGGDPSVADGLRLALARLPVILGYAAISATVGLFLRGLQKRTGWIGRWIAGLIGVAWTVATFLAVPVLVSENVGPVEAIRRSAALLKKTWGENLIGNAGLGLVFVLAYLGLGVLGAALLLAAVKAHSPLLIASVGGLWVIAMLLLALIQAALQGIYAAALFRYASDGEIGAGFDAGLVVQAFHVKT